MQDTIFLKFCGVESIFTYLAAKMHLTPRNRNSRHLPGKLEYLLSKTASLTFILCLSLVSCQEENIAPSCRISEPSNNSVYRMGDLFPLAIGASDPDGEIAEVQVYVNNQLITSLKNPPYTYTISTEDLGTGSLVIKAVALDNGGLKASDEITVRVDELELPSVYTNNISSLSSISVIVRGQVSEDGGTAVTEMGVCWNREGDPSILDEHLVSGQGLGHFSDTIHGLDCNTTYYIRAYASNEVGTAYGMAITFATDNLPGISTHPITEISATSAECGGTVIDLCGSPIIAKGVCWRPYPNPTTNDMYTDEGGGSGSFISIINDLEPGVRYYIRSYASVSAGTIYGEEVNIRTWDNSPISDVEGNKYKTVEIGNQIWMAENLRATQYSDGTKIPLVESISQWDQLEYDASAYCWYDNDTSNADTYGALYTWTAATRGGVDDPLDHPLVQGACPDGWHLPDTEEWTELIDLFGGHELAGGKLKEEGIDHWQTPNTGATNGSGFTGLPGGYREHNGRFFNLGLSGYWRSANWPNVRWLYYDNQEVGTPFTVKETGISVRCLKD